MSQEYFVMETVTFSAQVSSGWVSEAHTDSSAGTISNKKESEEREIGRL